MGKHGKAVKDGGRMVRDDSESLHNGGSKKKTTKTKEKPTAKTVKIEESQEVLDSLKLQQLALNIFKNTFPDVLASETLQSLLQEVKGCLYARDFERAFGRKDYLEAYSVRWSPSRALCYQAVLIDLQQHLSEVFPACRNGKPRNSGGLHAMSFGGGAAEVVAFGAFLRHLHDFTQDQRAQDVDVRLDSLTITDQSSETEPLQDNASSTDHEIDLVLVDSADWKDVSVKLTSGLTAIPTLSKYANAAARESNFPLLDVGSLKTSFIMKNCLEMDRQQLLSLNAGKKTLITLLFTLNELYTASISRTTQFLLDLTASAEPGTLLLIVDSPGSYSETTFGPAGDTETPNKYPMKWLLEHALLATETPDGQENSVALWEKIVSDDSRWFRIHETLRYPIAIENMRYQIHLYRKV
ncbi:uncharacterized protein RCO7_03517 [Rhynchosporium graminicola]|uniref:25S rRNA (Uridine(2843)-N(3))-methyltransferase n=1 Tax=Rhynchosporium graminicola TaxID=2792576 RepID=A0A1E1LEC0_9HELO|nr:uncharacterized protein RCO7_03517 [Rhynchosporium commune]